MQVQGGKEERKEERKEEEERVGGRRDVYIVYTYGTSWIGSNLRSSIFFHLQGLLLVHHPEKKVQEVIGSSIKCAT